MNEKITGRLANGLLNTRLGHLLAHIENQGEHFSRYDYLELSENRAIDAVLKIRAISEEMDNQERDPIYESVYQYSDWYPNMNQRVERRTRQWATIFGNLIRDAAVTYTYMAARCSELDEALEYASIAVDLWDIHAELKRGNAVEQLRLQMAQVIDDV